MKALIIFTLLFVTLLARTRYHLIEVEDKNEENENKMNENKNGEKRKENVHHARKVHLHLSIHVLYTLRTEH